MPLSMEVRHRFETELKRLLEMGLIERRGAEMIAQRALAARVPTMDELGRAIGVSKQRAHQIFRRALDQFIAASGFTRQWIELHFPTLTTGRVSFSNAMRKLRRLLRQWRTKGAGHSWPSWHGIHQLLHLPLPEGAGSDTTDLDEICERIFRHYRIRPVILHRSAVCAHCGRSLPWSAFPMYASNGTMPFSYCRQCHNARMRDYHRKRKTLQNLADQRAARRLERLAGIHQEAL